MTDNLFELTKMDLFEGLAEARLTEIAALAESRSFAEGETIFEEGMPASHLFLLLHGRVRIQVQLNSRPENVAIAVLSQHGQVVGWSGLVAPQSYTAAARCTEPSTLLAFNGADFFSLLQQNPVVGFAVMHKLSLVISNRLRNLHQNVLKTF